MTPGCEPVRSAHKRHTGMPHFRTYPLGLTAVMHEIHQESIPFRNDCGSMATLIKGFQELLCIELIAWSVQSTCTSTTRCVLTLF